MSNHPVDTNPPSWQRYFAVEANNRGWELAEQPSRTNDECLELLTAAHAAAYHWSAVGNELNVIRAETLLALAHTLAGHGDLALRLSTKVTAYFDAHPTDTWEQALVYAIHSFAAVVAGDSETHAAAYAQAKGALDQIEDQSEREIVMATFQQVPVPRKTSPT